jgi:hypothetical protein
VSDMFAVFCPTHDARILLGSRHIKHLENTDHGVHLHWRCYCGTEGVLRFDDHVDTDVAVAA